MTVESEHAGGELEERSAVAIAEVVDPLLREGQESKNRARVGTVRPTALLYTSGIGATVDLPHFSVMLKGLESWDYIYRRRAHPELIVEPRLLAAVKQQLGPKVQELRQPPWQQGDVGDFSAAEDLGVPVMVFPQWLRCTGCDELAAVESKVFNFDNRNPFRPDQARFEHENCPGPGAHGGRERIQGSKGRKARRRAAVSARYMLACERGHLDEFPYLYWVHKAEGPTWRCPEGAISPRLRMYERRSNLGPQVTIECKSCGSRRTMREAVATGGAKKLPPCRGRHPHLGMFEECGAPTRLMLLGAANLWFPATISLLVLPTLQRRTVEDIAEQLRALPPDIIAAASAREALPAFRMVLGMRKVDLSGIDDELLWQAVQTARGGTIAPPSATVKDGHDPIALLEPEWHVLRSPKDYLEVSEKSAFKIADRGRPETLASAVERVVAVEKMKKVNAFIGFTRVDAQDRIGDDRSRMAPISRYVTPRWVPATEDRGEGIFLHIREDVVAPWEAGVRKSPQWEKHRAAHERNFRRRLSRTAADIDPDDRFPPPRYWALHTLAHLLIREMAMHCGYGSASLAERLYAWEGNTDTEPAAGLLIATTAPDSEGTLGGLVELSEPETISRLVRSALRRATRCSSDPICSQRLPEHPEDFLHGAACHFCTFASETSCERANRFLDRRFVVTLPGSEFEGLFQRLLD